MDNGHYEPDAAKWSITPNNMQEDILPDAGWTPVEWVKGVPQDMSEY